MRPMSDNTHHVQSSSSIRSSQKIEDAFRKMKVDDGNGVAQSDAYPDRPGERDCEFYLRTGLCGYGSTCRYNHPSNLPQGMYYSEELPERIGQPDCEYYLKTGACKYGSTCKYHHPKDRNGAEPILFNVLNLPMRQGEKPCQYYLRTGTCRFGVACKFHHPQPDNGHSTAAYGMSTFPSAGLHHAGGGLTMMPTYGTLPRPQLHQSYVPVMVSPSQGLFPPQSWATYMGGSNSMYGVKNQAYYSGSSAPMPMSVTLNGDLSERSEQQEQCRFFMNTGTCKYGDYCKYTHLGVRVSPPPPPNFINPFVLPVRPGQPACGSFKSYGFCKFGPNCNFDHSVLPYPAAGLPMPSLSLPSHYASPVSSNYQRISPSPSRSDSKSRHNDFKKEMSGTEKPDDGSKQVQDLSSPRS